jgi:demethylmenaquinone methyltransferase / 2-methoxy-6-polyprenyl-1,4-benzoquinol methylase
VARRRRPGPGAGDGVAPLPAGEAKVQAVRAMFDAIAPRYDLVNRVMTFRLDVRWRRRTVAALGLPPGSLVVDLAAGTGDVCRDLQAAGLRPVGFDLSFGMLAAARTRAPLVQADALRLPLTGSTADGATCCFALRNFVELPGFFAELARVVRPGGRIALLEVAEPPNRFMRVGHRLYFERVVPRIGALVSDGPFRRGGGAGAGAYRYLPRSVAYLPPPDELVATLRAAGFADARRTLLSGGVSQMLAGTRDG